MHRQIRKYAVSDGAQIVAPRNAQVMCTGTQHGTQQAWALVPINEDGQPTEDETTLSVTGCAELAMRSVDVVPTGAYLPADVIPILSFTPDGGTTLAHVVLLPETAPAA